MTLHRDSRERLLSILVRNEPDVVHKLTGLLRRRGFTLAGLCSGKSKEEELLRLTLRVTLRVAGDDRSLTQIQHQLFKILETVAVDPIDPRRHVRRETALVKIAHGGDPARLLRLLHRHRARIAEADPRSMIVEITADPDRIGEFVESLAPGSVIEVARSGIVAMNGPESAINLKGIAKERRNGCQPSTTKKT